MRRTGTVQTRMLALLTGALLVLGAVGATSALVISRRDRQVAALEDDDRIGRVLSELLYDVTYDPNRAHLPDPVSDLTSRLPAGSSRDRLSAGLEALQRAPADSTQRMLVTADLRTEQLRLRALRDRAEAKLKASVHDVTTTIVLSLIAFGLVLVVSILRLRAWTTLPLRSLAASVRDVARGDLHTPVVLDGPADFVGLAHEVEQLRVALLAQAERSIQAEEALAQAPPVLESLRRQLVPQQSSRALEGVSMGFASRAAEGVVAGDWCEVVTLEGGLLGIMVGDVSGHGVDPGLVALQAKLLILAALQRGLAPAHAVSWTHNQLSIADDTILTAWVGILNPRTGSLRYSNAGHPSGWHRDADGRVEALVNNGTLISTLGGKWATEETRLRPGSLLLLLTDGVLEARNDEDEQLGDEGVLSLVQAATSAGPAGAAALAEEVLAAARSHSSGRLADDATVLALLLEDRG